MLVGIYMPRPSAQEQDLRAFDGLEGEYFRRTLGALHAIPGDTRFIWLVESDEAPPCAVTPTVSVGRRMSRLNPLRGKAPTVEQVLQEKAVDVLLTAIDAPFVRTACPKVLFALDMLFHAEERMGTGRPGTLLPKAVKRACTEAKSILCPSAYVHKTCAARLEMGLEKTVVARAGVDAVFGQPQPSIVAGPYALFFLNRYTCRHAPTVIEAAKRNPDLFPPTLVIVGALHPEEPDDWGLPVIRVECCPDTMTAALMQHADMVLYPATGDGSGMTVLQAMRAGARLITTKSGALHEVAGTAPFYCEADNAISMLQVMRRMLDETNDEQAHRRQMARSLVLDCTWERCGKKILSAVKRSLL